jgi:hypothetical protein
VFARLRASGVTTIRVRIPWERHSRGPAFVCLDGSDGEAPDAVGVLQCIAEANLDVWVDAGPIAGGVPRWVSEACPTARALDARGRVTGRWATGDAGFRAAAAAWANAVATASMVATDGRVAIWAVDDREELPAIPADHAAVTVKQFQRWLRSRYDDDRSLAREWLRPGLRIDEAMPPSVRGADRKRWAGRAGVLGRRVARWVFGRLAGDDSAAVDGPWPASVTRRGVRQSLPVARDGQSPGQLADWHAFTLEAWQEYLGAMRRAVEAIIPHATFVAGEVGRTGTPGIGHAGVVARDGIELAPVPVGCVGMQSHDAAWVASSLSARASAERPVMVSVRAVEPDVSAVAVALSAVAEGAVAVELPEALYSQPDVRRFAEWLGHVEEALTASTRLEDRIAWIDEPAHGGVDPDDLDAVALRGAIDRGQSAAVYAAVREAGLAAVLVPSDTFLADEGHEPVALLVPTRQWIDLERYGSLVVHVLRGGDLVAFPYRPERQRDGTAFRSRFLWPPSIANGGRVQIRDGTSTFVIPGVRDGVLGDGATWIGAIVEAVTPRFRVGPGMRLAITGRLCPDRSCLVFVVNLTNARQAGQIGVPDPAALGLGDEFTVHVTFATSGATVRQDRRDLSVDLPTGGAVVARLFDTYQ